MAKIKKVTLELDELEARVLRFYLPILFHCEDLKDEILDCEEYIIKRIIDLIGGPMDPLEEPLSDKDCKKIRVVMKDREQWLKTQSS